MCSERDLGQDAALFAPTLKSGRGFALVVGLLSVVTLWGLYAYLHQYRTGLGVTGLSRDVFWGFYITNFVFFIGISHAGTLISAILRLANAEWRRAITRSAEVITVLVLLFGVLSLLVDLGRPDRMLYLLRYANFTSPLLWDVTAVLIYLTASGLYLWVAMIPDLALLRDHPAQTRRWLYRLVAVGWEGNARQERRLRRALAVLAVLVIPVAVSVHTVVSFVFAMTIQPGWHSAIFGPYFVTGAIFSGIAALIVAMALIRRCYRLHDYLRPAHFNNLGILLLVMTLLWTYFTFSEYLTTYYGQDPAEMQIFWYKLSGPFAPFFWTMVLLCLVVPLPILVRRRTRTVRGTTIAAVAVLIGMWLERFVIVVPTLAHQRLQGTAPFYVPTWVEVSILAGSVACFVLLYVLFTRLFPIVAIWEVREGRARALGEFAERVKEYQSTGL